MYRKPDQPNEPLLPPNSTTGWHQNAGQDFRAEIKAFRKELDQMWEWAYHETNSRRTLHQELAQLAIGPEPIFSPERLAIIVEPLIKALDAFLNDRRELKTSLTADELEQHLDRHSLVMTQELEQRLESHSHGMIQALGPQSSDALQRLETLETMLDQLSAELGATHETLEDLQGQTAIDAQGLQEALDLFHTRLSASLVEEVSNAIRKEIDPSVELLFGEVRELSGRHSELQQGLVGQIQGLSGMLKEAFDRFATGLYQQITADSERLHSRIEARMATFDATLEALEARQAERLQVLEKHQNERLQELEQRQVERFSVLDAKLDTLLKATEGAAGKPDASPARLKQVVHEELGSFSSQIVESFYALSRKDIHGLATYLDGLIKKELLNRLARVEAALENRGAPLGEAP